MTEKQLKRLLSTTCNARIKLTMEDKEYSREIRTELFYVEQAIQRVLKYIKSKEDEEMAENH